MNWLLLSTIGCSLFVLFTSSGTEKSSIRKTFLGIFLFPSASFCLMLKNQDRLLSLLEGSDPLRVLRNTESSLRSRVHNFSLRKHLFASIYFCLRSQPCAGLVFKKMESLFCSDDPDFYSSFPSFKGFRLRIKSVLLV